ncbi:MAG: YCF48-related protein, partial [candidate division Zixibacteria bacterium]|nr:YCF48-related protein [candidate division Zixibacteria bacterium]
NPLGPALYKTTDRGSTWISQDVGSGIFGVGVQFLNPNLGWATVADGSFPDSLLGHLRQSTDGGDSWNTIYTSPQNTPVIPFQFVDSANGWAIMDSLSDSGELVPPSRIIHTTDGGANWSVQFEDTTLGILGNLQFVDLNNGWVVGDSVKILKTTDGGLNWTPVTNAGISDSSRNGAIFFISPDTGWIGNDEPGSSGSVILYTTDGGSNWSTQNPNFDFSVFGIQFVDANNGWAVSDFGGIVRTTNSGTTWTPKSSSVTNNFLQGVSALKDGNNVWAVGQIGTILRTSNGGNSWVTQVSPNTSNLNGVSFVNTLVGYAVGDFGTILKTTDGGNNWTALPPPVFNNFLSAHFIDANIGVVVGGSGAICRTTNGGANWTDQATGSSDLRGVYLLNANKGVAVGSGGTILRTTDGGNNWISQNSGTLTQLNSVSFSDTLNGTAVGDSGIILRSSDGGVNWSPQSSGTSQTLRGVFFSDANNGTAVGDEGIILKTTDGGANWTRQPSGTEQPLRAVSFSYSNIGWTVGSFGFILAYKDCSARAGDVTGEGSILLPDIVAVINYLFRAGPAPDPLCRADANGNGNVLLPDIVYLINFLFRSGPAPVKTGECCL